MTDPWFVTRPALDAVWLIDEPQHVCCWLIAGTERAVLLDSGLGIRPIRPLVERLCPLPVELVTTHYHFDHVGGHYEFDQTAVHEGVAPLAAGTPDRVLHAYAAFVHDRDRHLEEYLALDRSRFGLITDALSSRGDSRPISTPATWTIAAIPATRVLHDNDVFDLGGRSLTVLHTPGHSPDSICLLDEREGILFAVDQFNIDGVYVHFADSDVAAFAESSRVRSIAR